LKYDHYVDKKFYRFHLLRTLKRKRMKETDLMPYEVMTVPLLWYGSEEWALKK